MIRSKLDWAAYGLILIAICYFGAHFLVSQGVGC